jgi:hypothetical protein
VILLRPEDRAHTTEDPTVGAHVDTLDSACGDRHEAHAQGSAADARPLRLLIGPRGFALGLVACSAWVWIFGLTHIDTLPPHEDEVLVLFVGRQSFGNLLDTVLQQRGGAPLHFLFAWCLVHLGGHLYGLRVLSIFFAATAMPAVGLLARRLTDRTVGLATAMLVSSTWVLLFNTLFGRMYSLFLLTSTLSCLALLRALDNGSRARFAVWGLAVLAMLASHPYGVLLLAAQTLYAFTRRGHRRMTVMTLGAVALLGVPLWRADLVLRSRYQVGVGGGGQRLGDLGTLLGYLRMTASDFSTGATAVSRVVLVLAAIGCCFLALRNRRTVLLLAAVVVVPVAFLLTLDVSNRASPETRHLIFVLPFFSLAVAQGLLVVLRAVPRLPLLLAGGALIVGAYSFVAWADHRTPTLFKGESAERRNAADQAGDWLAATSRPTDILMGYEPVFLRAWTHDESFSELVVPRADPVLAAGALESFSKPLGRAIWVFDAKNVLLGSRQLYATLPLPDLPNGYGLRKFGPYLVIRTRRPVVSIAGYLTATRVVTTTERTFGVVNADIELHTIEVAENRVPPETLRART